MNAIPETFVTTVVEIRLYAVLLTHVEILWVLKLSGVVGQY